MPFTIGKREKWVERVAGVELRISKYRKMRNLVRGRGRERGREKRGKEGGERGGRRALKVR